MSMRLGYIGDSYVSLRGYSIIIVITERKVVKLINVMNSNYSIKSDNTHE